MPKLLGVTQRQFFLLEVKLALRNNEQSAASPGPAPDDVARAVEMCLVGNVLVERGVKGASARPITFGRAMTLWEALAEATATPVVPMPAAPPQQAPKDGVVMPAAKRPGTPLSGPMPLDDDGAENDVADEPLDVKECHYGQPKSASFKELAIATAALVEDKNQAYGDAFAQSGAVLRHIFPRGVAPAQYETLLAVTRILDKLFRLGTGLADTEDPARDITGYGLLMQKAAIAKRLK